MDGDTAGSVAPIAGLPKVYIREFLRWVAYDNHLEAMNLIVKQQPTAELRPASYKQTDEDDLMPYWLLHKIETLVVKNRQTPVEVYQSLKVLIDDYDNNQLIKDITKFFKLFSINQWKRERYALSFHMDDHNLDPRTWCRTPILTGGYEEELEELATFIK
jgi:NAD+ synthase (glutamine-hydrolysing)